MPHFSTSDLQAGLTTSEIGRKLLYKQSVSSTQTIAHELAEQGAAHGTVILARQQQAGRGRLGRSWHSSPGQGIYLSLILKPALSPQLAPHLTLLTATVLADVLRLETQVNSEIKWPNDILINDKKVAGILTEMKTRQGQVKYVVIGIGLNVNQARTDLAGALKTTATSLLIETHKQGDIMTLTQAILNTFEQTYLTYLQSGFASIKRKWEQSSYKIGELIWVKTREDEQHVLFCGLADDGSLLVELHNGQRKKLSAAEIDWFRNEGR